MNISVHPGLLASSYLKAGLDTGTKAEADAKNAAIQKAVFIFTLSLDRK